MLLKRWSALLFFILICFCVSAQSDHIMCTYSISTNSALSLPGEGYKIKFYKSGPKERIDLIIGEDISFTYFYHKDSINFGNSLLNVSSINPDFATYLLDNVSKSVYNIDVYSCKLYNLKSVEDNASIRIFSKEGFTPIFLKSIHKDIKGLPIEIEMNLSGQSININLMGMQIAYPANLVKYFE